jgi:hypothetical protein
MVAVKLMLCALRHSPVSSEVILRRRHPIVSHRNELSYDETRKLWTITTSIQERKLNIFEIFAEIDKIAQPDYLDGTITSLLQQPSQPSSAAPEPFRPHFATGLAYYMCPRTGWESKGGGNKPHLRRSA